MSVARKILLVVAAACLVFSFSGCNTLIGLNRDIRDTTDGIDRIITPVEKKFEQDRLNRAAEVLGDRQ